MSVNLSIKSVPDEWAERLRQRAERNHRSLQGELMALVEQAVMGPAAEQLSEPAALPARLQGVRRGRLTTEQLAQILDERRARGVSPPSHLPTGAEIIRADRDSR